MFAERDQRVSDLADSLRFDNELRLAVSRVVVDRLPFWPAPAGERLATKDLVMALQAPTISGECRMVQPTGSLRPVLMPSESNPDKPELFWCCTGHDVEHCSRQVGG